MTQPTTAELFFEGRHPLESLIGPVLRRTVLKQLASAQFDNKSIAQFLGLAFSNLEALFLVANGEGDSREIFAPDTRFFQKPGTPLIPCSSVTAAQCVTLFGLDEYLPEARRLIEERNTAS